MYTKKYVITNTGPFSSTHDTIIEVEFDGDVCSICQKSKDTGDSKTIMLSEDNAWDLRNVIQEVLGETE